MLDSILTAILTVILGWASIWVKNKFARAERRESERDRQAREALEAMLSWWSDRLANRDAEVNRLTDMSRSMIVWAPDRVLIAYADFLEKKFPELFNSIEAHEVEFGKAVLAYRKHLGFRNRWRRLGARQAAAIFKAGWKGPL